MIPPKTHLFTKDLLGSGNSTSQGAMAPRKRVTGKPVLKQNLALKKAELEMEQAEIEKKKQQSNMVTQLKQSADPNKVALYNLYTQLSKNSPEKSQILQRWLADKSCSWTNEYSKSRTVASAEVSNAADGWGSK